MVLSYLEIWSISIFITTSLSYGRFDPYVSVRLISKSYAKPHTALCFPEQYQLLILETLTVNMFCSRSDQRSSLYVWRSCGFSVCLESIRKIIK